MAAEESARLQLPPEPGAKFACDIMTLCLGAFSRAPLPMRSPGVVLNKQQLQVHSAEPARSPLATSAPRPDDLSVTSLESTFPRPLPIRSYKKRGRKARCPNA